MQLKKLQYVQNTAARIVTQTRKFEHITPVLFDRHWFPLSYRIVFKIFLLVFKLLNNLSPNYLAGRLSYQSHSRNLRSASKQLLEQPRSFTIMYEDKAFSVCFLKLWNSLPLDLPKSPSLTGFKKGLKAYLFREFLESGSLFLYNDFKTCNIWSANRFLIFFIPCLWCVNFFIFSPFLQSAMSSGYERYINKVIIIIIICSEHNFGPGLWNRWVP